MPGPVVTDQGVIADPIVQLSDVEEEGAQLVLVIGIVSHVSPPPAICDGSIQDLFRKTAAEKQKSDQRRVAQRRFVSDSLQGFDPTVVLDLTTPAVGHCFLHALRLFGLASMADRPKGSGGIANMGIQQFQKKLLVMVIALTSACNRWCV